jgi:hydrogenase maturation protease
MKKNKTIVFGIGNIGRQDDGLGWLFLDHLKEKQFTHLDLEYRYQLQIEDAELITKYDNVIFVDAVKSNLEKGYFFKECKSSAKYSFSTHELAPETVLYLAENLYQHKPKTYILGIEGVQWNLEIGLTDKAKLNFKKAKKYFTENIVYPRTVIQVLN